MISLLMSYWPAPGVSRPLKRYMMHLKFVTHLKLRLATATHNQQVQVGNITFICMKDYVDL